MHKGKNSFGKVEKLCSKKIFAELFEDGDSFFSFPFRVVWKTITGEFSAPSQIAISVPKRSFKRAVDRNLIKRRIREAFRKNKHELYTILENSGKKVAFIVIFQDNKIPDYQMTEKNMTEMLRRFVKQIREKGKNVK